MQTTVLLIRITNSLPVIISLKYSPQQRICSHNPPAAEYLIRELIGVMINYLKTPIVVFAIAGVGVLLSSTGCRKKKDTIAKIYVRDVAGEAVSGATVRLSAEDTDPNNGNQTVALDKTATTNASGEATFNFNDVYQLGQAGVAVLDIDAQKDGMSGSGIIKIEQEKTSEETVFI
jgi:hypothetical protein